MIPHDSLSINSLPLSIRSASLLLMAPEICPTCGADVPENARACPECGADDQTGWSEKARYDSLGIPDDESFNYSEWVKREFGDEAPDAKRRRFWRWVGLILVGLLFLPVAYFVLVALFRAR
jgi:ribosomal protein L40E